MEAKVKKMKQYRNKQYGGNGKYTYRYRQKNDTKKDTDYKKTTYPWKNQQKTIQST